MTIIVDTQEESQNHETEESTSIKTPPSLENLEKYNENTFELDEQIEAEEHLGVDDDSEYEMEYLDDDSNYDNEEVTENSQIKFVSLENIKTTYNCSICMTKHPSQKELHTCISSHSDLKPFRCHEKKCKQRYILEFKFFTFIF